MLSVYLQFLDLKELKGVLLASRLELNQKEMRRIMAEVDIDGDGRIDYEEFLPVMITLIRGIKAQSDAAYKITASDNALQVPD